MQTPNPNLMPKRMKKPDRTAARNSLMRIEDTSFQNLIKKYTGQRRWDLLRMTLMHYGHILEERDMADA